MELPIVIDILRKPKVSTKIIKKGNNIDVVTTKSIPRDNFKNLSGREKVDYDNITNEKLRKKCKNKAISLSKHIKRNGKLANLVNLNDFNKFITISNVTKGGYSNFIDKVRKSDKDMKFISIAIYEPKLHYHIVMNTKLSNQDIKRRYDRVCLDSPDIDVRPITDKSGLLNYLRKNLIDNINILNSELEEDKDKQIYILKHNNIISCSRNINKPEVTKLKDNEDVKNHIKDARYKETILYNNVSSSVQVDKFEM